MGGVKRSEKCGTWVLRLEGAHPPAASVVGLAVTPTGAGYTMVDAAGSGATYGA